MKYLSLDQKNKQLKRHFFSICHTATVKKLWNLIKCYLSFRGKKSTLNTMPVFCKFEVATACNLRCPGCLHGSDTNIYKKNTMMSFDTFKRAFDQLAPYLFKAIMYHQGESFLNKDSIRMIEYATKKRVHTSVSTNFSFKFTDDKLIEILNSGLSHLIVSIDGITQEVYEKYRVGGNLDLVLENVSKLVKLKKQYRKKLPLLEFQFIIFEHNKHQLDDARKLAGKLGVDRFTFRTDRIYSRELSLGRGGRNGLININETQMPGCKWLWFGTLIKISGAVMPCCMYLWESDIPKVCFGKIYKSDFYSIWNSYKYVISRKAICSNKDKLRYKDETICSRCPAWPRRDQKSM